ncbi:MAG: DUF2877 domain-containing protein [Actinomycetes bacterium]
MHDPLPVAAASPLVGVLTGSPLAARVVQAGRLAAYLVTEGPEPRVVVLADPGAVLPSCAVVLPRGVDVAALAPAGAAALLGGGGLTVGTHRLAVRRWWRPLPLPRGVPDRGAVATARAVLAGAGGPGAGPRARAWAAAGAAAAALGACDPAGAATALVGVLGLGPGSTPAGDDVAAGVLLSARSAGLATVDDVAAAVLTERDRTTPVSAGLLAEAAAGRASREVLDVVRAVTGDGDVVRAVRRLLEIGHTSGADLAAGLLAVAHAVTHLPAPSHLRRSA